MSIKSFTVGVTGLSDVYPNLIYIDTTDALATVKTAGYLNGLLAEGVPIVNNKSMVMITTTDHATVFLVAQVANDVVTLVSVYAA